VEAMAQKAAESGAEIVIVTGGEPLMYELGPLCDALHTKGLKVHLETSGAHPLSGSWDWICFSPKKFKAPLEAFYTKADELKVIIYNQSDFEWAESHAEKVNKNCHLFLQAEWSKRKSISPKIIEYIKNNPKWQISIQTHNYLEIP